MRLLVKIAVAVVLLALPVALFVLSSCNDNRPGCIANEDAITVPIWRETRHRDPRSCAARERWLHDLLYREYQRDGSSTTYLELPAPQFWIVALNRLLQEEDACLEMAQHGN